MSAVKLIVVFLVVCALLDVIASKPHQKRHQRSEHPSNGYFSEYQLPLNYPPPNMYQPYQQPYYSMPQQMPYPIPQAYPPMPYYMPYNYYPPMYPSYPMYPPYPYYQPYPYQPQPQNYYPDPYAHIPTEIVDVDSEEFNHGKTNVEVESSHSADAKGLNQPVKTTSVVTTKPIQTIITRTFDSSKSEPEVKVESTDSKVEKQETEKSEKPLEKADEKESKSLFSLWG